MVTLAEYIMGRDAQYPLTQEQWDNAEDLIEKLVELEDHWTDESGEEFVITSGYRPAEINAGIAGAKPDDAHTKCMGVDLRDTNMELSDFLLRNLTLLEQIGFWMESPQSAKDHVHLQIYAPHSGHRVFIA
jgi:uncharacterized protein YcbK (DUF882 family)